MGFLRSAFNLDDDGRRALRAIGGLLVGTGFLVALQRRSGQLGDAWGPGAQFAVTAIPCAFLLGLGFASWHAGAERRPWQGVYVVFGLLLLPLALASLVNWIGSEGDAGNALNVMWLALVTACVGFLAALRGGVRFALLIAGLAVIVAWLALWEEVLSEGIDDVTTLRWLLVVIAAALLAMGALGRARMGAAPRTAGELVTAGGVAAVLATLALSAGGLFQGSVGFGAPPALAAGTSFPWDLAGLVVAVALIGFGARLGVRGPVYVGSVGLFLFVAVVGVDLDSSSPDDSLVGWPLALVALGFGAAIASLLPGVRPGSLGLDRLDEREPGPARGPTA